MEVFERLIEKMAELEKTSEHKAYYYRVSDSLTIMICGMLRGLCGMGQRDCSIRKQR